MNFGKHSVLWFVVVLVMIPSACTATEPLEMPAETLNEHLNTFAADNEITAYQLSKILSNRTWNSTKIGKGGVGIIDGAVYVVLDGDRNSMLIDGEVWTGSSRSVLDVVGIENGEVLSSGDSADGDVDLLIIFLPQEIYFLNLELGSSGKYLRSIESGANASSTQ